MLYVSIELFHQIPIDFNGFCNRFGDFYKSVTDRRTNGLTNGPTDQPTDQRTDIPSYRDAIAASKNGLGCYFALQKQVAQAPMCPKR